jgi:hypothetical protein
MVDAINQAITDAATTGIQSMTADGETVVSRPIPDLIEADRYLKGQSAAGKSRRRRGLMYSRIQKPGAI